MFCIAMITRRRVTKCSECGAMLDLRNGGLFFHDVKTDGLHPICGECTAKQNAPLALCGALYGQGAKQFNELNPHEAVALAMLDHLPATDAMIEIVDTEARNAATNEPVGA